MDIVERLNDHAEFADKVKRFADADCYRKGAEEIARLRAEPEAARVDAERYRWLRENALNGWDTVLEEGNPALIHAVRWSADWREKLDAAIDAARGGK